MQIGVLSDTHGYVDDQLFHFFNKCEEVWHAGDIGSMEVVEKLTRHFSVIAVSGNIDGGEIRNLFPGHQRLTRDGLDIWMTHIGGYPGNYDRRIRNEILEKPPGLFISGHSHILKVIPDSSLQLLHINPGAAGYHGMHLVRTAVRFEIVDSKVQDVEIIELGPRSVRMK